MDCDGQGRLEQPLKMQHRHKEGEKKAKPARRDPEKRRQQNQRAQKKYREKKKQRITELEQLVASISPGLDSGAGFGPDPAASKSAEALTSAQSSSNTTETLETAQLPSTLLGELDDSTTVQAQPIEDFDVYQTTSGALTIAPYQTPDNAVATPNRHQLGESSLSACPDHIAFTGWSVEYFNCGCKTPHIQIRGPGFKCSARGRESFALATFNYFPDPWMNNLRLEQLCIVEAMLRNCLAIGITQDMWCSADSISPFYRQIEPSSSSCGAAGDDAIVRAVQGIFRTLKPDLRPCREQISAPHHPYIDILPFPTVRANLIKQGSAIDEDEFFYDLLNGLICWGGAGAGRHDDRIGAGSGTPWESRSWEAKECFIQKWWSIVGGEDGELTRQSRWWRSLRGEDQCNGSFFDA
ncbi:hypothetical protein C8A03DRAFT_47002 [Achaetomium macrosporum]|uniref:BZIP domain-containing protein n=1 Tax=Achaetomium macrosporum TaxID=79813 RepID=A0AAN7C3J9_9PEZI|nr:hypothetical protein C8A03DRAFT_47002 [Achaetomium macrosporum]